MSYFDFEDFFKIAEKASMVDILRDPAGIRFLAESLEESAMKVRIKGIVSWLALEQLFISERNEAFETAMREYYESAISEASKDVWTKAKEMVEEQTKKANQYEAKRREFEEENKLLKQQQIAAAQIKQELERKLREQHEDMQKQIAALRDQVVQMERQAATNQAELDRAKEKNRELEKKLKEKGTQGQSANPTTKSDDNLLILDYTLHDSDAIMDQLNQLSSRNIEQIKRILIKGPCTVAPPIYGFNNLIEIEFLSVKVIRPNAIRMCPSLVRLVFHDKDCIIPENFMERDKENRYPLQEIVALPGGHIEAMARNNNIQFRSL